MSIAIIGTGNMGLGLGRLLAGRSIPFTLAHRESATAREAAAALGPFAQAATTAEAARAADIVILAVPYGAAAAALAAAGDLTGKILVDITNPLSPDYRSLTVGHTTSAAEEVQRLAPGVRVVKAFNTVFWQALPFEVRQGKPPVQVFLASDDAAAKEAVAGLVRDLGFEAVDAGPLVNARYIEPMAQLNILLGHVLGWGAHIAPAFVRL